MRGSGIVAAVIQVRLRGLGEEALNGEGRVAPLDSEDKEFSDASSRARNGSGSGTMT